MCESVKTLFNENKIDIVFRRIIQSQNGEKMPEMDKANWIIW